MKIAISSTGEDLTAKADPRFGRAPYFVLLDDTDPDAPGGVTVLKNEAAEAAAGAGTEAARQVIEAGANVIISGSVGPNAFQVFEQMGIPVYLIQGDMTVREAYERYQKGELTRMIIKRL